LPSAAGPHARLEPQKTAVPPVALVASSDMADEPKRDALDMSPAEISLWLSGGAEPGSIRHEHAKAALAWRVAQVQADASGGRRWATAAAIAAVVAAVAAVASVVVAIIAL
jgi:hypothetical protein